MNQPAGLLRHSLTRIRQRYVAFADQSERTILLGTVLLATGLSAATVLILTQYFSVDALSSLLAFPYADCYLDWGTNIGRHCFSDYAFEAMFGTRPNPWEPYLMVLTPDYHQMATNNYPAAAMIPQTAFGLMGKLLGAPRLGLLFYLIALTVAVFSPAVWASRGARGLDRVVVFVACGTFAVPLWAVIDRGNSVGFAVPIVLVFLVALGRERWGLVAVTAVLAALVKPQFVLLVVVLFAVRQWRKGGIALTGAVVLNLAAYLFWPRDFPRTIMQSVSGITGYGGNIASIATTNVSFGRALLLLPDALEFFQTGGKIPEGFLAGPRAIIGYAVVVLVVGSVLALGRRIPPLMVGIVLLPTAFLFPAVSVSYYLVFALPIAAVIARDPDGPLGSGIFDRLATAVGRHRAVSVCVSLATALTLAQIALPHPPLQMLLYQRGSNGTPILMVLTTEMFAPILWLITIAVIIVSYARRRANNSLTGGPATASSFKHAPAVT